MTLYVTPDRFAFMGLRSDLASYEDKPAELASILDRASAMADAYCAVPLRPQRHSFLGGSITGEEHLWRIASTPFEEAQRRLYPWHVPVRTVSRFRIYVTQPDPDSDDGQYVNVAPADLMVNRSLDYFEVVSSAMTSTGLFNALIVPAIYLAAPKVVVDYTYGYDFVVTDEPVYATDGLTYSSQNNYWTDDAVEVKVNGTTIDPGAYSVDRVEGRITFSAPPDLGTVTVSYHHRLPIEIRDAVGYVASHLISEAKLNSGALGALQTVNIAGQISVSRRGTPVETATTRTYLGTNVPEAAHLLDDFSNWRVAA